MNLISECDTANGWRQHPWGSGQACFKSFGYQHRPEAAALCRENGGQLPLPRNDEENEYFTKQIGGGMIDSFDLDGDGIWHDSYGNEVTYFAPFWYYPIENLQGGVWQYGYMSTARATSLDPQPANAEIVWTVYPNLGKPIVRCMIPLASSCRETTSYADMFTLLAISIDFVNTEVLALTPGSKEYQQYQNKGARADKWLKSIVDSTYRFVVFFCY